MAGATVLPGVSTDGYTYDDSEAVEDDKFLGLALQGCTFFNSFSK